MTGINLMLIGGFAFIGAWAYLLVREFSRELASIDMQIED